MDFVATVRALKFLHGGAPPVRGRLRHQRIPVEEDLEVLGKGCANVAHHVACLSQKFNVRVVVAVNKFATDTSNELQLVEGGWYRSGSPLRRRGDHWAQGGHGAIDLAEAVVKACAAESTPFRYLYPLGSCEIQDRGGCSKIYLAGEVTYSELASSQIDAYEQQGLGPSTDLHREDPVLFIYRSFQEGRAVRSYRERARNQGGDRRAIPLS